MRPHCDEEKLTECIQDHGEEDKLPECVQDHGEEDKLPECVQHHGEEDKQPEHFQDHSEEVNYLNVSRIMVKRTNFPRSGTTREVGGMISANSRKNTVKDSRMEMDRDT
jgi:hypothetical protein